MWITSLKERENADLIGFLSVENFLVGYCGEYGNKCLPLNGELSRDVPIGVRNEVMSFFIGNCEAKTDAKGRVFLPSVYRRLLPDGERGRVVMRMDPENECLVLYPEGVWNRMVEELQGRLDEWDAEDRLLLMQFVSDAEWMDIDSQGRILIQKRFLSAIGAGQTLLFVGMIDRIAVWGKERYESAKMGREDFARRLASKMKGAKDGE